jgi:DNA-binding MarR family transcriptional regulator
MLYNELSQRMDLSPSRGSRVIYKLVEHGYVVSESNLDDRRSQLVTLSKKGEKTREKIEAMKKDCESKIISQFKKQDIAAIKDSLTNLINSLDVIQEYN